MGHVATESNSTSHSALLLNKLYQASFRDHRFLKNIQLILVPCCFMWLCVCDISPPPMRAAFSSWVQTPYPFQLCKTIFTSWKGLCGYDRDDMSCQDFCTMCMLRTVPSHFSICKWHVIRAVQHLHVVFSCFLIFLWWFHQLGVLLWECYYIMWTANPSSSLKSFISCTWAVVHLPKQYMVLKIVVNGFQVAGKAQLYFSF